MRMPDRSPPVAVETPAMVDVKNVQPVSPEVAAAVGPEPKPAFGTKWRSAPWFLTTVVTIGITSDILAYTIVVPVLPYRLQSLHYNNVAVLMSWLLFAYSAGIFFCTFPVAFFFHRYPYRRGPLVIATLVMEASFVLFMLAPPYWAMVISRFIQGGCSCVIWTVGFALICENINPANLGTHLGFAFSGLSIGATIAPPIGGALYKHLGWHSPFIFMIIISGGDTLARLIVLDKRDLATFDKKHAAWTKMVVRANAAVSGSLEKEKIPRTESTATGGRTLVPETEEENKPADALALALVPTNATAVTEKPVELSPWQVLVALASLPRGMVAFLLVFVFGFIVGALDATLTLRVETIWHKDSDFVGLIYLAAAAPAFFGGPIAGWLADKYGGEWLILPSVILCLPWLPLMILTVSLPAFVVFFALTQLVVTVLNSVASLEMAIVSKFKPGISEIHEFAAMNLAFAVSSAIGAIVGGQIYDHVHKGWDVLCWIGFAAFAVSVAPPLIWTGKRPLLSRMLGRPPPRSGIPPEERDLPAQSEVVTSGQAGTLVAEVQPRVESPPPAQSDQSAV